MERSDVLNRLIAGFGFKKYLEIGVAAGTTFFAVASAHKVAVDPYFLFKPEEVQSREPTSEFHQTTSDTYFADQASASGPFDLIFLDGLHTIEQILRDFLNACACLAPGGVIVIDDVLPDSYAASLNDETKAVKLKAKLGAKDDRWMGDVFKLVPFIDAFCQMYSFASPIEASNCLVVWKAPRQVQSLRRRSMKEIADFPFEQAWLDESLYNSMALEEIVGSIAQTREKMAAPI